MHSPHYFPHKFLLLPMILQSQALFQLPPMGSFKSATEDIYLHHLKHYTRVLCANPPTSILKLGRDHTPTKDAREIAVDYAGPTQLANAPFVLIGFVTQALSLSEIALLPAKPQKLLKREWTTGTLYRGVIQLIHFLCMFNLHYFILHFMAILLITNL